MPPTRSEWGVSAGCRPVPVLHERLLSDNPVLLDWVSVPCRGAPYTRPTSSDESHMETVPWTVGAFRQRRRQTWKAIRLWLVLMLIGFADFWVPFYLERTHVRVENTGSRVIYKLSMNDMTGSELIISLISFVAAGTGVVGTVVGIQRYYRCPRCESIPMASWTILGPTSFGWQSGVEFNPTVCRKCGAKLR